jgi:hypothetical protein
MTLLMMPAVSKSAAAYLLEQSLLFNGTNQYLTRTPSTAGNRKTWTYSVWVKGNLGILLGHRVDGSNYDVITFGNVSVWGGYIQLDSQTAGTNCRLQSSALFRDPSAWYHIVVSVDTTQATAANRVKFYVNGTEITAFGTSTYPSLNFDFTYINNTVQHGLGTEGGSPNTYFSGLMALPILVDGAALDATSFGEEDDDGYWNPIEFTGVTTLDYINPAITAFIGNMTGNGGLSAISDGSRTYTANTALSANGVTANAFAGVDWGVGVTKTPMRIVVQNGLTTTVGPSWDGNNSGTINMAIYGSNSAPASYNDGTLLGSKTGITNTNNANLQEVFEGGDLTTTTGYRYHWVHLYASATEQVIGEVQFFAESATPGYGTNGGAYDFADTADFGKDVNYTGDTSVTFTDSSVNSGSAATYTFSSQAIGTASADRVVVVGTSGGAAATNPVSSMTIGGVSAVKAIGIVNSTGTEIWYATVTSGTTASVVVNWGGTKNRCGIGVWALTGVTGVGATNTSTSSTATLTVSGRTKDIVLAVYGGKDHASVTFTGLTEDYDEDISGAGSQYQAGGSKKLTATGSNTITVTPNTGATEVAAVSAVFLATGNNGYLSNNFTASDQLADTPTDSADDGIGNFATWNPLIPGGATLSLANKRASIPADKSTAGTIAVNSGKWRFQAKLITLAGTYDAVGIAGNQNDWDTHISFSGGYPEDVCTYQADGRKAGNSAYTAYGSTFTTNDVIDVFFDADTGTVWFAKNGTLQASATETEVENGTTTNAAFTGVAFDGWGSKQIYPAITLGGSGTSVWDVEFDAAKFTYSYAGITSYLALATQNLPAPTIADGSDYFNTVLYTGDGVAIGSGGNAITGVGFQPDFVWFKSRSSATNHQLFDSVRGAENVIYSSLTNAEGNFPETLSTFDVDGFTVGNNGGVNTNTETYVAWCWKANGAASSNTDGTITSSVSANTTSGFSIVTYTGTGVAATVGHGLGVPNDFMIFKSRSNVSSPGVVTSALGFTKDLLLETTDAAYTRAAISNNTAPTSTVFSVGTDTAINVSGYTYVAYCWAEVEGFSKFGSYTGNGSAAGPFIYTGFRPAFVIIKKSSAAGTTWNMFDNKRDPFNLVIQALWANASDAEYTYTAGVDFLSNGFRIVGNPSQLNASAATHIYMAFAEHPFQGGTGATTQGRAR